MRARLLGLSALTAVLLASGAASADVIYPGGVGVPTGSVPGGFVIDAENSAENSAATTGATFNGIFTVQSISPSADQAHPTFQSGVDVGFGPKYLTGAFTGFTVSSVTFVTATGTTTIALKGGEIDYYVHDTNTYTTNSAAFCQPSCTPAQLANAQSIDFANATTGTLWLGAQPIAEDAAGDTLILTVPGSDLSDFASAGAIADLDVIAGAGGGLAGANFDTNGFTNDSFAPGGTYDIAYQGSANTDSPADFPITGSNFLKANVVPEPMSVALFGAGLVGAAAFGARRRKARKS